MRLATAIAAINLVAQTHDAIVVGQIEAGIGIQVLNLKEGSAVVQILETHPLGFAGAVPPREHAAILGTGVAYPGNGLGLAGPFVAAAVAGGRDALKGEEEEAGDGGEHGWGLHGGGGNLLLSKLSCVGCEGAGCESW